MHVTSVAKCGSVCIDMYQLKFASVCVCVCTCVCVCMCVCDSLSFSPIALSVVDCNQVLTIFEGTVFRER